MSFCICDRKCGKWLVWVEYSLDLLCTPFVTVNFAMELRNVLLVDLCHQNINSTYAKTMICSEIALYYTLITMYKHYRTCL